MKKTPGEAGQHLAQAPLREWHCPHVGPGTWQPAKWGTPSRLSKYAPMKSIEISMTVFIYHSRGQQLDHKLGQKGVRIYIIV